MRPETTFYGPNASFPCQKDYFDTSETAFFQKPVVPRTMYRKRHGKILRVNSNL